jgi:anti-sigma factor RsiW
MTGQDPHDLDELLGAYALDAVDDDERRRVEEYLAANPRAANEVREHREVATMLSFSGGDAPPGLWERIAAELDGRPPAPGPELARVLPMEQSARRRRRMRSVGAWLAATAAAVLVAVVLVGILDGDDGSGDPLLAAADAARADRDSRTATLAADGSEATAEAIVDEDGHGYLVASDLPSLADDQTYQLWGFVGDNAISLGVLGPNPEIETFTIEADVDAFAVTIEPAGGVVSNANPDGAYVGTVA